MSKIMNFGTFYFNEIFDHKKLIEGIIKLYQSIERKLLYKTLYLYMSLCVSKKRKIRYSFYTRQCSTEYLEWASVLGHFSTNNTIASVMGDLIVTQKSFRSDV
jgi:hypothetical protein